ncbi:MAG TPA: hypothetical protein VJC03_07920 [bacterium]|nr:hypothetical protein [bacterium]
MGIMKKERFFLNLFVCVLLALSAAGCGRKEIARLRTENDALKSVNESLRNQISVLEQSMLKFKETDWYHYQQGLDALKVNDYETAKLEFETVVSNYPESTLIPSAKMKVKEAAAAIKRNP